MPSSFAGELHLRDGELDRLHRQHGDAEQPVGVGFAVIGEPAVVGAAHRGGEARVLDRAGEQAKARVKEGSVDPVGVHVEDAGMRVEAAFLSFGIFEAVELDRTLPDADGAETADPTGIAEQLALDAEALLAVFIDDEARPAVVKRRIDVLVPEIERLEDVTVGIDGLIGAGHGRFPHQRQTFGILPHLAGRTRVF